MPETVFSHLREAAETAFRPDFDQVLARERRRRGRRAALASGLAVALVATGLGLLSRPDRAAGPPTPGASASPATRALPAPDLLDPRPVAEVWPQAIRRLPARMPDGSTYHIVKALGGERYLVHASAALWTFDTRAGTAVLLLDHPTLAPFPAPGVYVSGDWLLRMSRNAGGVLLEDIVAVRLTGGAAVRVATGVNVDAVEGAIVVVGDQVVWTAPVRGGTALHRAPLAGGGQVTPVPDGTGWFVNEYGWAERSTAYAPQVRGDMWNLATGERRPFVADPRMQEKMYCSPQACFGYSRDFTPPERRFDGTGAPAVQRLDGTGYVEPVSGRETARLHMDRSVGRFAGGWTEHGTPGANRTGRTVLWELGTGQVAILGEPFEIGSTGVAPRPHREYWVPGFESGAVPLTEASYADREHEILDLTAI